MHDIFISYAAEDRHTAQAVAAHLIARGLRVWWDEDIAPGTTWVESIEQALNNARCVIVLWSESSVRSKWVRKEARYAETNSMLVPALVQDVAIPFEFEHVQAARLVDWTGEPDHPGIHALTQAAGAVVRRRSESGSAPRPQAPNRRRMQAWHYRVLAGLAAVSAALWALASGRSAALEHMALYLMWGSVMLIATLLLFSFVVPRLPHDPTGRRRQMRLKRTAECVLPFCAALFVVAAHAQQNKPRQSGWTGRDITVGERFLQAVHRRDMTASYNMAAQSVRATMSIGQLEYLSRRYLLQITAPPLVRSFEKAVVVNGRLVIAFVAEFDHASRAREFVTFAWEGDAWRPAAYDIWPTEWPVTGYLDNTLTVTRAADVVQILRGTNVKEREAVAQARFAGRYVPGSTGWSVRLDGGAQQVADRTCHVGATEQDTGTKVMLWKVLDGCRLPANTVVSVFGRVRAADDQRIELEAVRVLGQ
jgi:hypothetical protein